MRGLDKPLVYDKDKNQYNSYARLFSYALASSVSEAISTAGGHSFTIFVRKAHSFRGGMDSLRVIRMVG